MKTELPLALRLGFYAVLVVLALPFAFPTWWMVTASLKPVSEVFAFPPTLVPHPFDFSAYPDVFRLQPFARQYSNSLYIAAIVTAATMLLSSLAGYGFARFDFPGRNLLFLVVLVGLLIPSEVTIVPLFQMYLHAGMVNTHWPLILSPIFGAPGVFATFLMRQFFITLPAELEEAARIDGYRSLQIFWLIAIPLARPALAAVAIFTFLYSWNLYLEPTIYLSNPSLFTLPQALTQFVDAYGGPLWTVQLAAATMTAIPVLVVFVVAQRFFVEGLAQTGLKG